MKKIVIDLDGTLTVPEEGIPYEELKVDGLVRDRLMHYKNDGYEIIIYTARNMRTYGNSLGKIMAHTLPIVIAWLDENEIPYDEVHVGKPWCGEDGFYVDDRAVRPGEFVSLTEPEIQKLLAVEDA